MNMTKRMMAVVLAAVVLSGCLLAGCGSNKAEEQKSQDAIAAKRKRDE